MLKVTSGDRRKITDQEVDEYFSDVLSGQKGGQYQYMITADGIAIGHIALSRRSGGWHETMIVIGEKDRQGKGYGARAIRQLLKKARRTGIRKVYLEVRPDNMKAIRAYEACGFRKVKVIKYPKSRYLPQTIRMEPRTRQ